MSVSDHKMTSLFMASLKLGLTSFGGPIAHLGYFHEEYVRRRKWLDERQYADLVALAQFLPGPASSQVGIGVGIMRAGLLGGIVSFLGFTLPSAIVLALFALWLHGSGFGDAGWLHGLKLVAVAIVAHAVWGMGQKLAAGRTRMTMAVLSAVIVLVWNTAYSQFVVIAAAAIAGWYLLGKGAQSAAAQSDSVAWRGISKRTGWICLTLGVAILILLPIARELTTNHWVAMADSYYRSGSLVFGGGHVVLPLLEREVVPAGWVTADQFISGYSAAQAVPGPLFTFASYLGAISDGWLGAAAATFAIFLPAYLLMAGVMPIWQSLQSRPAIRAALGGVNAAVVGILLAALYDPIWISAVASPSDFAIAVLLFVMLVFWKLPPWMIVLLGAACGTLQGIWLP
ncbi:chromate transporter [Paenibacillus sp. strain BS8-2]